MPYLCFKDSDCSHDEVCENGSCTVPLTIGSRCKTECRDSELACACGYCVHFESIHSPLWLTCDEREKKGEELECIHSYECPSNSWHCNTQKGFCEKKGGEGSECSLVKPCDNHLLCHESECKNVCDPNGISCNELYGVNGKRCEATVFASGIGVCIPMLTPIILLSNAQLSIKFSYSNKPSSFDKTKPLDQSTKQINTNDEPLATIGDTHFGIAASNTDPHLSPIAVPQLSTSNESKAPNQLAILDDIKSQPSNDNLPLSLDNWSPPVTDFDLDYYSEGEIEYENDSANKTKSESEHDDKDKDENENEDEGEGEDKDESNNESESGSELSDPSATFEDASLQTQLPNNDLHSPSDDVSCPEIDVECKLPLYEQLNDDNGISSDLQNDKTGGEIAGHHDSSSLIVEDHIPNTDQEPPIDHINNLPPTPDDQYSVLERIIENINHSISPTNRINLDPSLPPIDDITFDEIKPSRVGRSNIWNDHFALIVCCILFTLVFISLMLAAWVYKRRSLNDNNKKPAGSNNARQTKELEAALEMNEKRELDTPPPYLIAK